MALKIRLARSGSKKRPFYRIVVADIRAPRDGRFIEILGTYNPLLAKSDEQRVTLKPERIQYWLGVGAKPTDRVLRFLDAADILTRPTRNNPQKALPGKKAQARLDEKNQAEEAPAEEAPAEEVPADDTPAEDAPAEDAPAEEAAAQ